MCHLCSGESSPVLGRMNIYTEADLLQILSFCPSSESVCMLKNNEPLVDWWLMCTSCVSLMVIVTGGDSSFSSLTF